VADAASSFQACYRTGNGTAGNIGRDSLAHIATAVDGIRQCATPWRRKAAGTRNHRAHPPVRAVFVSRAVARRNRRRYGRCAKRSGDSRGARHAALDRKLAHRFCVGRCVRAIRQRALVAATLDRLNRFRMAESTWRWRARYCRLANRDERVRRSGSFPKRCARRHHARVVAGTRNGQPAFSIRELHVRPDRLCQPLIAAAQAVEGVSSVGLSVSSALTIDFDGRRRVFSRCGVSRSPVVTTIEQAGSRHFRVAHGWRKMNGSCNSPEPTLCGCREGAGRKRRSPWPIAALPAIAYRLASIRNSRRACSPSSPIRPTWSSRSCAVATIPISPSPCWMPGP